MSDQESRVHEVFTDEGTPFDDMNSCMTDLMMEYRLNHPDEKAPAPNSAFCHHPAHVVVLKESAAITGWDDFEFDMQWRYQLVVQWICLLSQLDWSHLFDGTERSSRNFTDASGLTPTQFARAYLEADGSLWQQFTPCTDGNRVVSALLKLWEHVVEHWNTFGGTLVEARGRARTHFGKRAVDEAAKVLKSLSTITVGGKLDSAKAALLQCISPRGAFDCRQHPRNPFCSCAAALNQCVAMDISVRRRFVDDWIVALLKFDDTFTFTGKLDHEVRQPDGTSMTPWNLASQHLADRAEKLRWHYNLHVEKATVIKLMIDYWTVLAKELRTEYKTRREARTVVLESMKGRALTERTVIDGVTINPTDPRQIEEDPLLRMQLIGRGAHRPWALLYPGVVTDERDNVYLAYRVVRYVTCHVGCEQWKPRSDDDAQEVYDLWGRKDLASARAVKPEW